MDNSEKTLSTLHRLKQLGVRISMDDFGTGYSSLSYLRSFPFDKIKVDRAFVSDLAEGTEHVVIVQAVVSIARALGMTTTAEGVETVGAEGIPRGARLRRGAGLSVQRAGPGRESARGHRRLVAAKRPWRRKPAGPYPADTYRFARALLLRSASGMAGDADRWRCAFVPEQEQPGRHDDAGADEQPDGRHVAPDQEADDQRPDQHEIIERRHRRRRRQLQRPGPEILPGRVGDAAENEQRRVERRRPAEAEQQQEANGTPRSWPSATSAACWPIPVCVMPRTATVTLPYITALPSANSAPSVSESAPGLVTISTPKKPDEQRGPARQARRAP